MRPLFEAIQGGQAPPAGLPVRELRARAHEGLSRNIVGFYAEADPLPAEHDHRVQVDGGAITVRTYAPEAQSALPCHVYFHGGGFWAGELDHFDALCRAVARDAQCLVAAVDYRLAPEHKFPAAAEDAYAALLWVQAEAGALGIDPARISVGGVSAGGNLAAVACLMARDRGTPPPVLQVLEIPVLDMADWSPLCIDGIELASGKDTYCAHYLADPAEALLPYVSPLRAPDLSGLPPALIHCAEYDALTREGEGYARRLAEAGVPVEYHLWPGQFHGAQPLARLIPQEAAAYLAATVAALRRAYGSA